jgi:hypothetical protein
MFAFIEFLKKRPSDATIRIMRIVSGLLLAIVLGLAYEDMTVFGSADIWARASLFILPVLLVLLGIFDPCMLRRKYFRTAQLLFAVILFILSYSVVIPKSPAIPPVPQTASGTTVSFADVAGSTVTKQPIDIGFWLFLFAFFPLLAAATGKCISKKCFKYGEKITKIRV